MHNGGEVFLQDQAGFGNKEKPVAHSKAGGKPVPTASSALTSQHLEAAGQPPPGLGRSWGLQAEGAHSHGDGQTQPPQKEAAGLWSFHCGWVTSKRAIKLLQCIIILTSLPFSGEDKPNFNLLLIESLSRDWLHRYAVRGLFFFAPPSLPPLHTSHP